nr:hypothetical protein CFP56_09037 [Quercus suber]
MRSNEVSVSQDAKGTLPVPAAAAAAAARLCLPGIRSSWIGAEASCRVVAQDRLAHDGLAHLDFKYCRQCDICRDGHRRWDGISDVPSSMTTRVIRLFCRSMSLE